MDSTAPQDLSELQPQHRLWSILVLAAATFVMGASSLLFGMMASPYHALALQAVEYWQAAALYLFSGLLYLIARVRVPYRLLHALAALCCFIFALSVFVGYRGTRLTGYEQTMALRAVSTASFACLAGLTLSIAYVTEFLRYQRRKDAAFAMVALLRSGDAGEAAVQEAANLFAGFNPYYVADSLLALVQRSSGDAQARLIQLLEIFQARVRGMTQPRRSVLRTELGWLIAWATVLGVWYACEIQGFWGELPHRLFFKDPTWLPLMCLSAHLVLGRTKSKT